MPVFYKKQKPSTEIIVFAQSYAPRDVFVWRKQHQMEVTVDARVVLHQPIRIQAPVI